MMQLIKRQWQGMKRKKRKGFTLLEMLLVVFIIAALLLLVLPNLISQQGRVTAQTDEALVTTVQTQVSLYQADQSKLPENLEKLEETGYLSEKQLKQANQVVTYDPKTGNVTVKKTKSNSDS